MLHFKKLLTGTHDDTGARRRLLGTAAPSVGYLRQQLVELLQAPIHPVLLVTTSCCLGYPIDGDAPSNLLRAPIHSVLLVMTSCCLGYPIDGTAPSNLLRAPISSCVPVNNFVKSLLKSTQCSFESSTNV